MILDHKSLFCLNGQTTITAWCRGRLFDGTKKETEWKETQILLGGIPLKDGRSLVIMDFLEVI